MPPITISMDLGDGSLITMEDSLDKPPPPPEDIVIKGEPSPYAGATSLGVR